MLMFSISVFSLAFFLIDSFLVKLDFKWHSLGCFILPEEVVNRWGRVAPRVDCAHKNNLRQGFRVAEQLSHEDSACAKHRRRKATQAGSAEATCKPWVSVVGVPRPTLQKSVFLGLSREK